MKADDESMCCAGDVFDKKLLGHTRYVVSASSVDARRHSYRQRRTRFDSSASVFTQHATNYGSSEPLTWPSMQRTSLASPRTNQNHLQASARHNTSRCQTFCTG